MRACVALVYSLFVATCGVTVHQAEPEQPNCEIQVPLTPIIIKCTLSDIIAISAPVVRNALYFLNRPDGTSTRLNITRPTYKNLKEFNTEYDSIVLKQDGPFKTIVPVVNYKVFDVSPDSYGDITPFEEQTKDVNANDFLIGPLLEEDHGNWILSVYYQEDEYRQWVEMFQVITIEISDYVPPHPRSPKRVHSPGDTFKFSFAYPIPFLESCELHAPRTAFDRFYERNMEIDQDSCGYVLKNVTLEDRGMWSITGMGKIVYNTQLFLDVQIPEQKNMTTLGGAKSKSVET